jgi:small subunit ribosomal protein S15
MSKTIGSKSKKEIIENSQVHETDTGSSEVQIAVLTERINHLVEHLKIHKKDHHTRRGLLILVGKRKKIMKYLQRKDKESFGTLAKKLNLKVKD